MTPKALHRVRRSGLLQAKLFDEDATRAVLALASAGSQDEATAVFEIMARGVTLGFQAAMGVLARGSSEDERFLSQFDWRAMRDLLQRWLPKVANFDRLPASTKAAFLAEFNKVLRTSQMTLTVSPRGLGVTVSRDTQDVSDVVVLGLMPFLDPRGWSPRRLGQCRLEGCDRWFLRPEVQRGATPFYCSPKHASVAHVRAFRKRQEAQESDPKQPRRDRRRR